jgi:GAF domain-containing protein
VVSPALLRVGPYQGTVGCLEIPFGKGVCGTSADERRTVIVADVNDFPGHISCDARSRSEIVVPVFDATRRLIAVLDVDSDRLNAFDTDDQRGLERIVTWFAR